MPPAQPDDAAELAEMIARTGLPIPAAEQADLLAAWRHLHDMRERVRRGAGFADEPAHVFAMKEAGK
jgi:hypothetical protein